MDENTKCIAESGEYEDEVVLNCMLCGDQLAFKAGTEAYLRFPGHKCQQNEDFDIYVMKLKNCNQSE